MGSTFEMLGRLSATVAGGLIASTWEAGLLALIVWICLRLVPGVSAAVRSLIWGCAFLMAGILPFLGWSKRIATGSTLSSPGGIHFSLGVNWAIGIIAFWAVSSVFRVAQLVRSAFHLAGVARRAKTVEFAGTDAVCVSSEIDVPCVAGFFAPRILIPAHLLASLTNGDLAQIVAHEAAHLRRFDHWTNLVQKVLVAVYPIHPVMLWIERRLCEERELACDDTVTRQTGARKQYALCLTKLAEQSMVRRGFTLALRAWGRQPELTRRVLRILSRPSQELSPAYATVLVATMVVSLGAGAFGLSKTPALVGFHADSAHPTVQATQEVAAPAHLAELGAKATLVKASIDVPAKRTIKATATRKRTRPLARMADLKLADMPAPRKPANTAGWVMLTTWQSGDAPRMQPAIVDANFTYAAVPTRSGWLIIQL